MTSPVNLTIAILLANPNVRAAVGDRIDPHIHSGDKAMPRLLVRSTSSQQVNGLARPTSLRQSDIMVLAMARSATEADNLAELVTSALHATPIKIREHVVTVRQEGEDSTTFLDTLKRYVRFVGYQAWVGAA